MQALGVGVGAWSGGRCAGRAPPPWRRLRGIRREQCAPVCSVRGRAWGAEDEEAYERGERSREDGGWRVLKAGGDGAWGAVLSLARGTPEVMQLGEPVLRSRAAEVSVAQLREPRTRDVIEGMVGLMRQKGVGLAGPQVGVPSRIIVLEDTAEQVGKLGADERKRQGRDPFDLKVLVNPVLTPVGDQTACEFEGCLSVAGYRGMVERWWEVDVEALGADGEPVAFRAQGWLARILQHEVDHLDGTVYVDRMVTRSFRRVDLLEKPLPSGCPPLGTGRGVGFSQQARSGSQGLGAPRKGGGKRKGNKR